MKPILLLICLLISFTARSQSSAVAQVDTGVINGADYRIDLPANWGQKGNPRRLVMYAHGYETIGSPRNLNEPGNLTFFQEVFLKSGYAVAQSAYRQQGWAVSEGVEDTEALRKYFVRKYGQPDSTFITGHSMGGMITVATIEKYPNYYQAGMPLCPNTSRIYDFCKTRAVDMLVTFDALFPGTLPPLGQLSVGNTAGLDQLVSAKDVKPSPNFLSKLSADSVKARHFAERYDLKPGDLVWVIPFYALILADIGQKAGGNPFDNTNTVYGGFGDNIAVNAKAVRLTENPAARRYLEKDGAFTGKTTKPLLALHTTYDQLIPSNYATGYDDLARQAGNQQLFVMKYTNAQGHCEFTPQETALAFNQLRQWVKYGIRPTPGELKLTARSVSQK